MRAKRFWGVCLVAVLACVVVPAAPAAAARPAPPQAAIVVHQDVDPDTGAPVVVATYTWSGFRGRVTPTVTVLVNGSPVTTIAGTPNYSGRSGDLGVAVPAEKSATTNTFTAQGSLVPSHGPSRSLPASLVEAAPVELSLVAAPCDP